MPTLDFSTKYKKNTGLMLSPAEFRILFFYGIDIKSKDGTEYGDEVFEFHLRQAQDEIEKYFEIKLLPELITETQTYYRDEYMQTFPIIQTNYTVTKPYSLIGFVNNVEQIVFPESWLSSRNNRYGYARRISVVPTSAAVAETSGELLLSGVIPQVGTLSFKTIPDYYTVQYKTGFGEIQWDLLNLVGMLASIQTLAQAGDLILGAGIASQSLSIDSLSQSISSTSSATNAGYGARISEYRKTIKETVTRLKKQYKGIRFVSM